jgi:hypothetical protein
MSGCAHALAHTLVPSVLLLASVVLVGMTRTDGIQSALDLVSVFAYTKAPVDRAAALHDNTRGQAVRPWHADPADAAHCLDMSYFNFPSVKFVPGADPTSPTCQIAFSLALAGQHIRVTPVYDHGALTCRQGIYPLQVTGATSGVPSVSLSLSIEGNGTHLLMSIPALIAGGPDGFAFANRAAWAACRDRRWELARQYLGNTSCASPDFSPMCTCVHAFVGKLTNLNHRLRPQLADGQSLEDTLRTGVDRCIALRRHHDVRTETGPKYARSKALLVFALALFFNSILLALGPLLQPAAAYTAAAHAVWLGLFLLSTLLAGLLSGGQAEFHTVLATLLPAFFLHGAYHFLVEHFIAYDPASPKPYLHPVVFDLCLCSLTLFTLVERGVVQSEYLLAEVFKCHAIALLYMAAVWYHRHMAASDVSARTVFSASTVHQGYTILVIVALAAAADSLLVPYPAKAPFELHWLLPLAFTFLALSNPGWVYALNAQLKFHPNDPASRVYGPAHFNCLAAALSLGIGFVLWGYFLRDYIRVYGAAHFPYGTLADLRLPLLIRSA